jgi:MSHA biogenesis protein MshP
MRTSARATGMALISAIFLIVVLLGLGVAMMKLSNVEHDTASKSVLAAKVYYGAKAGLDWGIQQAIAADVCTTSPGTTFSLSAGLSDVTVNVQCNAMRHGSATSKVYYVASVAKTGTLGTLTYAERHMEATVSNIP